MIPNPPPLPESREFRKLADGTLGELDFRVLLSQYTTAAEGEALAAHLAGGSYELFEHKREKFPVLGVASTWDSPESARKYFEQYRKVMQGKWKKLEIAKEMPEMVEGHGDSGYFRVWMDGRHGEPDGGLENAYSERIAVIASTLSARSDGARLPASVIRKHKPAADRNGGGIRGSQSRQQGLHGAASRIGQRDAQNHPGGSQQEALLQHDPQDVARLGPQRDPNRYFGRTIRYRKRQQPMDAEAGQQARERGEGANDPYLNGARRSIVLHDLG